MIIVFNHIPKTGGMSIRAWMQRRRNYSIPEYSISRINEDFIIHNHIADLNKILPVTNDKLIFHEDLPIRHIISVRDPISRCISSMNFTKQRGGPFGDVDFYDWFHTNISEIEKTDYEFIQTENLQEDFNRAFRNSDRLDVENVTMVKEYSWDTMSDEEKDKLREKFQPEYDMLKSYGIEYNMP